MTPFSRFSGYFVEVARHGSLRKAAEVLHVSASAIDRQILQAEAALDVALFERLAKGLKLTAAGEQLLGDVQRWHKEYGRTVERLDEIKGLKRGRVRLAVIEALGEGVLIKSLVDAAREYPYLTFDIRVASNEEIRRAVSASDVDFGLLLDPIETAALEVRASASIPLGIAAPAGHALTRKHRCSVSDALEFRQIMPSAPLIVHDRARALYARHRVDPNHSITCNDVRMMRALIRSGAGVGILSLLDVAADVEENRLAFVPLSAKQAKPLSLAVCVTPRRQLSRAAQVVMQRVSTALKRLG